MTDNYQGQSSAISGMGFGSITQGGENKNSMDNGLAFELQRDLEFSSWNNVVESSNAGYQSASYELSLPSNQSSQMSMMPGEDNELLDQVLSGAFRKKQEFGSHPDGLESWQVLDVEIILDY